MILTHPRVHLPLRRLRLRGLGLRTVEGRSTKRRTEPGYERTAARGEKGQNPTRRDEN